jgi:hypothetical protein
LLGLNHAEEISKYFCFSPSSIQVVKLMREEGFSLPLSFASNKGFRRIKKYFCCSQSSILLAKLISVERKEDGFSLLLLTAYSLFRIQL